MLRKSLLLTIMLSLFWVTLTTTCFAEKRATREECIARVEQAAKLIGQVGAEAAFKKIMDPAGPFIWKDAHVFCIDTKTAILLAHSVTDYVGSAMRFYTDAEGGAPYSDILDLVSTGRSQGWLTYISDRMGRTERRLKHMHYRKVADTDIVICAGYYPETI